MIWTAVGWLLAFMAGGSIGALIMAIVSSAKVGDRQLDRRQGPWDD